MTLYDLRTNLQAIVADAAGLPTTSVFFGDVVPQVAPKAFIRISDIDDRASLPEARWSNTPGSPSGSELTETTVIQTWISWRIEYFCPEPGTAVYLLRQLVNGLQTSSMRIRMDTLGWAMTNMPKVQRLPVVKETVSRDRATCTLTLSMLMSHTDLNTFISSIQGTATISSPGHSAITVPYVAP